MIFVYFYSTSYTADIRLPIYIRIYQQFTHNMHIILPICKYTKYFRTTKKYLLSRRYCASPERTHHNPLGLQHLTTHTICIPLYDAY